jgi:hypothetical protein
MANTVRVFDFKMHISGAIVVARPRADDWLCPGCLSDEEVDANIQSLKDDLDAVAKRMKKGIRERPPLAPRSKNAPRP